VPIDEPLSFRCQPTIDYLPDPDACKVTGIGPMQAFRSGLPEPAFAARIAAEMSEPGTCVVGYNSLRFDDELTRHLFWRNFIDPYAREWQNGNSRFDLIDVIRAAYALRPEGMVWPVRDDGAPSFRLDQLAPANGIAHDHAHTALADVEATLALARRLQSAQPRLCDYALSLRDKQRVLALLDWRTREPLVHVSQRFPAARGCLAIVVPLAFHPQQAGKVIVYDSHQDPTPLLHEPPERLAALLVQRADEGERTPLGLKLVHANRVPFVAPLTVLKNIDPARIGLDEARSAAHVRIVQAADGLDRKVQQVYAALDAQFDVDDDADSALYSGFIGDADRQRCTRFRQAGPTELRAIADGFADARLRELALRYRCRHHPDTLTPVERTLWRNAIQRRWHTGSRTLDDVRSKAAAFGDAIGSDVLAWVEFAERELAGLAPGS
jgi:exodeoxyribonuclease-1